LRSGSTQARLTAALHFCGVPAWRAVLPFHVEGGPELRAAVTALAERLTNALGRPADAQQIAALAGEFGAAVAWQGQEVQQSTG
jgi:hypothetical protein